MTLTVPRRERYVFFFPASRVAVSGWRHPPAASYHDHPCNDCRWHALILLARIGQLVWLEQWVPTVWVPGTVIREVDAGKLKDVSANVATGWAIPRRLADSSLPESVLLWDLGPGKSQVIAYALQRKGRAVLDDAAARRCAQAHGVAIVGSIGVVLRAKNAGLIAQAKPWREP